MHGLILFDISFLLMLISYQIDFFFGGCCNLDKEKDSSKDVKRLDKSEKKKESTSSGQAEDSNKKEKNGNGVKGITTAEEKGDENNKIVEKKDGAEAGEEIKNVEKKEPDESAVAQTSGSVKPGKKKIIKKIVKQKVVDKTAGSSASKQIDKLDEKDNGQKNANLEIPDQQDKSVTPAKTFVRKKVVKKVSAGKTAQNEGAEDKPKDNSDPSSAAVVEGTSVKTTVKKKIIKRIAKKKVSVLESSDGVPGTKKDADWDEIKVVQPEHETKNTERQAADAENLVSEVKRSEKKTVPKTDSKTVATKKQGDGDSSKTEIKADKDDKEEDERKTGEKSGMVSKVETDADKKKVPQNDAKKGKLKDGDKSKDEKVRKENDGKDDSRSKSNKDLKEKRKPEEPPRHPGLILQTKWSKESKVGFCHPTQHYVHNQIYSACSSHLM